MAAKRVFTKAERAQIVTDAKELGVGAAATKHNVNSTNIYRWQGSKKKRKGKKASANGKRSSDRRAQPAPVNGHGRKQDETKGMPPLQIVGLQAWLRECVREEMKRFKFGAIE